MEHKSHKAKIIVIITICVIVAVIAAVLVTIKFIIPNNKYNKAVELKNNGQYIEAIAAFENLDGYKDSAEQIVNCQTAIKDNDYDAACELMNNAQYDEAIAAFEKLDGYRDSAEQIVNCQTAIKDNDYDAACELMNNAQYDEAITAFEELAGYRDSAEQIVSIKSSISFIKTLKKTIKKGNTFYYGNYNGKPLEWTILDKQDNQVLAITTDAVAKKRYNETWTKVTWSTCSLRTWLNNDFINEAFSSEEQSRIMTTTVNPGGNPWYKHNVVAGKATKDKIFLLSIDEVKKYFSTDEYRQCKYYGDACRWWLRSPGCDQGLAAYVYFDGAVGFVGWEPESYNFAVRPALWINLES